MDNKKKVEITLYLNNSPISIVEWMSGLSCFSPTGMKIGGYRKGRFLKYKETVFAEEIKGEVLRENFLVYLEDMDNSVWCLMNTVSNIIVIASAILQYEVYYKNEGKILQLINQIMNRDGIVANIVDLEDNFWQNTTNISNYIDLNKSLEGIPTIAHPRLKGRKAVDVEKFPGYEQMIGNIWAGAAWKMWFSKPYYEFVPKECIERFRECYSNEKISDDCYCITLYKDLDEYSKPENREKQWKFKEAINFPEVVKKLKEREKNIKKDPEIEIKSGEFEHGGVKQFWYYVDKDNNLVRKSKAVKVKIEEYHRGGYIIWRGEQEV